MADHGTLDLTPFARWAFPTLEERTALRARVPAGHRLWISSPDKRTFTVRLHRFGGEVVATARGPLTESLDAVLAPTVVVTADAAGWVRSIEDA